MTTEERAIWNAAAEYTRVPVMMTVQSQESLGRLITAVMSLPMSQWPANACLYTTSQQLITTYHVEDGRCDLEGVKC